MRRVVVVIELMSLETCSKLLLSKKPFESSHVFWIVGVSMKDEVVTLATYLSKWLIKPVSKLRIPICGS